MDAVGGGGHLRDAADEGDRHREDEEGGGEGQDPGDGVSHMDTLPRYAGP
jgi:hypothetical protein